MPLFPITAVLRADAALVSLQGKPAAMPSLAQWLAITPVCLPFRKRTFQVITIACMLPMAVMLMLPSFGILPQPDTAGFGPKSTVGITILLWALSVVLCGGLYSVLALCRVRMHTKFPALNEVSQAAFVRKHLDPKLQLWYLVLARPLGLWKPEFHLQTVRELSHFYTEANICAQLQATTSYPFFMAFISAWSKHNPAVRDSYLPLLGEYKPAVPIEI